MDRKINLTVLILILILGAFLRLLWLEKSPPSLNWDEAALGYNAYSLSVTVKDEFGKFLPISLRSFDDYKPAVYSYLAIPAIRLFGLNEFSVRLPSALAGTILIFIIYLLTQEFFSDRYTSDGDRVNPEPAEGETSGSSEVVALIAAFLIAIDPWAVHFSRVAFETNLALLFLMSGVLFIVKTKFKNYLSTIGLILLILSAYTYHSEKILLFPLILILVVIYHRDLLVNHRIIITNIIIFIVLLFPLLWQSLNQPSTLNRISSTISISNITPSRYLAYFSPVNLFVRGTPEPTQQIPNFAMFYAIESIFWLIGLFSIVKNYKNHRLLIALILIFPLPAAITWNWFYPARVLPLFAMFTMVITYGIYIFWEKIRRIIFIKVITIIATALIMSVSVSNLATSLWFYLPYKESGNWQYDMKLIMPKVAKYWDQYSQVVIETKTAQPYIFALYYFKYSPPDYQKEIIQKPWINNLRSEFNFGKFVFRDVYWNNDRDLSNTLLVGPVSSLPTSQIESNPRVNLIENIQNQDGEEFARIVGLK